MNEIMEIIKKIGKGNFTISWIANTIFVRQKKGNNVFQFELDDEDMRTENIKIRIVNVTHGLVDNIRIYCYGMFDNKEIFKRVSKEVQDILSIYWSGEDNC